jgi:hypothetical protein
MVMKIYIKNMVCQGTKLFVLHELDSLGIVYRSFGMGEIDFDEDLSLDEIKKLDSSLRKYGLEIIFADSLLVARIREAVLDLVENKVIVNTSFSYYISERLGINYTYLNDYFNTETGLPIEEYYLEKRDEKMTLNLQAWSDVLSHFKKSA